MRSGIVSTVGPVSNEYPSISSSPLRPPGTGSRSSTVTRAPGSGEPERGGQAAQSCADDDHVVGGAGDGSHAWAPGVGVELRFVEPWRPRSAATRTPRAGSATVEASRAAAASATRDSTRRSTSARAPVSTITSRSASTDGRVQARVTQVTSHQGLLLRARPLQRERDQHGALALAQVVAGRLAGLLRVAEHAEHVVAQLERLAERQPVRRVRRKQVRRRTGQSAAQQQRVLDRVLRALVPDHLARAVGGFARRAADVPARACRGTARPSARCASGRRPGDRGQARHRRRPDPLSSSSLQDRHRSPSRIAAA